MSNRLVIILASIFTLGASVTSTANASVCNAMLEIGQDVRKVYSFNSFARSLLDDMCQRSFSTREEFRKTYSDTGLDIPALFNGSHERSQKSGNFSRQLSQMCKRHKDDNNSASVLKSFTRTTNTDAVRAWTSCIRNTSIRHGIAIFATPQDNAGKKFTIDVKSASLSPKTPLIIETITPDTVTCKYARKNPLREYNSFEIALDCDNKAKDDIRVSVGSKYHGLSNRILIPAKAKTSTIDFIPKAFYHMHPQSYGAFVVTEVEVYGENNERLEIDVTSKGCYDNCAGIIDTLTDQNPSGSTSDGKTSDKNKYWVTHDAVKSIPLATLRVILRRPAVVHLMRLRQSWEFYCMSGPCGKTDSFPTIAQKNLREASINTDNGIGFIANFGSSGPNKDWITVTFPQQ